MGMNLKFISQNLKFRKLISSRWRNPQSTVFHFGMNAKYALLITAVFLMFAAPVADAGIVVQGHSPIYLHVGKVDASNVAISGDQFGCSTVGCASFDQFSGGSGLTGAYYCGLSGALCPSTSLCPNGTCQSTCLSTTCPTIVIAGSDQDLSGKWEVDYFSIGGERHFFITVALTGSDCPTTTSSKSTWGFSGDVVSAGLGHRTTSSSSSSSTTKTCSTTTIYSTSTLHSSTSGTVTFIPPFSPPTGVPEFAFGAFGVFLMVVVLAPALAVLRKRRLGHGTETKSA